jgi:type II secretory pathway pseudopilin PulG
MPEMMIAIVILGLGLLMAATMFPVAWTRARQLAEQTTVSVATSAAETTVRMLATVSKPLPVPMPSTTAATTTYMTPTSFVGDYDEEDNPVTTSPASLTDTFVHVLHLENALATPNAAGATIWPEYFRNDNSVGVGAGTLAGLITTDPTLQEWDRIRVLPPPPPQVAFHERLIPPLDARPTTPGPLLDRWQARLADRRFAWAVLHRFVPGTFASSATDAPRQLSMYYVTLRRSQSTHRFARQADIPGGITDTAAPTALGPEDDMMFAVPWLVRLEVLGNWGPGGNGLDPTGVPSEAVANPDATDTGRLIAQMLHTGSVLIDRITGSVYTVQQHRFTGTGNAYDFRATLTLDQEIKATDLGASSVKVGVHDDGTPANLGGDLRDFWVFPPPVLPDEREGGFVTFDGVQPVVNVEVRQMRFVPR